MFETFLVQPILNLLVGINAIVPGHNFGLTLIIFTILVRLAMWPLIKKQLHHAKAMRELQPEIRKIKKEAKGDKQKEAMATMALYKEREVNAFAGIGYLIIQLPIFIALYQVVNRIANDPNSLVENSYQFVRDLPYVQNLAAGTEQFDPTVFGTVDLTRIVFAESGIYLGALVIAIASAVVQYYASKQLMASQGEKKSFRQLLKDQADGKEVDQADMNAAVGKATIYIIPGIILLVSLGLVAALPFYWLVNGIIGYYQQKKVLDQDLIELTASVDGQEVTAEVEQPKRMNAKQKREAMKANKTSKASKARSSKNKKSNKRTSKKSGG